jgi:hypothetical protein
MVLLGLLWLPRSWSQRTYADHSVLASGNWYKISVSQPGVYKVDLPFLRALGITATSIPSGSIRLFGNGGQMLPEACNGPRVDDLAENAIEVVDGGDGQLNGSDYFLFYASGPDQWWPDSANRSFRHQKNLYSNRAFYFITIGGNGKRIAKQATAPVSNTDVSSFSGRYFYEQDSVNLLSSGKEWFSAPFSASAGNSQRIPLVLPNLSNGQASINAQLLARSATGSSRFTITVNGQSILRQNIAASGTAALDPFAKKAFATAGFSPAANMNIDINFSPGGPGAQGWLDWLEVFWRQQLITNGNEQLLFRDWNSVGPGKIARYTIQQGAGSTVWDISTPLSPRQVASSSTGTSLFFSDSADRLHEYVCFSSQWFTPQAAGPVANQDLHAGSANDLIIITSPGLAAQAQSIAAYHSAKDGMHPMVATTEQVYNEFSSGIPDPTAIRDMVKLLYDRAAGDSSRQPKYLLLLGDGSYDYLGRVKDNHNLVPAWQTTESLDPLGTYTSDDFFGFLDDADDINNSNRVNLLNIGVGRVPAQTVTEARAYADKLNDYTDPKSLGPWRNQTSFVADDQDLNLHLNDAEAVTAAAASSNPVYLQNKTYLDAYTQQKTPFGNQYPDVNAAINQQIQNGTLIWNYNGHGSYNRLAEETILDQTMSDAWTNNWRLPMMITATCDFAPYDNPAIHSLGERILLREKAGAIALMTTTRAVVAYSNRIMNSNYLQAALLAGKDGRYPTLGEALLRAKNVTYSTQSDIANNRKFSLLGDPALTLAFPRLRVHTTHINGKPVNAVPDTLRAFGTYSVSGTIEDASGNLQSGFNGILNVTVFDKPGRLSTLANDADSYVQTFSVQNNRLFSGVVNVVNGHFDCSFRLPADINPQPGNGFISYYAQNGSTDANGYFNGFLTSVAPNQSSDRTGPVVKAWLNDRQFVNGSSVSDEPLLLVDLSDSSGINIAGAGTGHDMLAILDGDSTHPFVLNSYYTSDTNNYRSGTVLFRLPLMGEGLHRLRIVAWDGANNKREASIDFTVKAPAGLSISLLRNYPNPFTASTRFWFLHNRPNQDLHVSIYIYSTMGNWVKTISQTINTSGSRSSDIEWDGTADTGTRLTKGVYFYQVRVKAPDGQTAGKAGKLLLL